MMLRKLHLFIGVGCSFILVKSTKIREGAIGTWSWGLNLHLPVLIDNGFVVVSDLGLLCLVVYGVVVLIQVPTPLLNFVELFLA